MTECRISEESGWTWIHLNGRIDSMTSPDIQQRIHETIQDGARMLVADMEQVSYLSSAGLRIFIMAQKQLQKAGGRIIIYRITGEPKDVFTMSGFDKLFKVVSSPEEIASLTDGVSSSSSVISAEHNGVSLQYIEKQVPPGTLIEIGSQEKLSGARYAEDDVETVNAGAIRFGTGLAAPGGPGAEHMQFFGESVVLDNNFFFYPAVKRPAVDFMLNTGEGPGLEYMFLHGFGFSGDYCGIFRFDHGSVFVSLSDLVQALFQASTANMLGLVLLAESKGLWGMHLKKIPVLENRPQNGGSIFDEEHFAEWMNFPVEPADINNIIAGAGLAVRDRASAPERVQGLLASDSNVHLHAGVFAREPLNKNIEKFDQELTRVVTELDVFRVQHILGQSLFSGGMVGIIELTHT